MRILCESCHYSFDTDSVLIWTYSDGTCCYCPICGYRHNVKVTVDAFGTKFVE